MKTKEIILKESTIKRVDGINKTIKEAKNNMGNIFLTILEHQEIDPSNYDLEYEGGKLILTEKPK